MSEKEMPSRQALDKAVKPAGTTWEGFSYSTSPSSDAHQIALAYAADLDKADKVGRMILEVTPEKLPAGPARDCRELARELILPDPIDPDLLEAEKIATSHPGGMMMNTAEFVLAGIKRGRELAKEQDRG